MIVGLCLPEGISKHAVQDFVDFSMDDKGNDHSDVKPADSLTVLEQDTTGLNVYFDTTNE